MASRMSKASPKGGGALARARLRTPRLGAGPPFNAREEDRYDLQLQQLSDPADLHGAFEAVTEFLESQSVKSVSGLWLDGIFTAEGERLQVRRDNLITHTDVVRSKADESWAAVPRGEVAPPQDQPCHPLGTAFGHDD